MARITGNEVNGWATRNGTSRGRSFGGPTAPSPIPTSCFTSTRKTPDNERIAEARKLREKQQQVPYSEIADPPVEKPAAEWAEAVKAQGLEIGADDAGITLFKPEWVYNDRDVPQGKWAIVLAFSHDYDNLKLAPNEDTYIEVMVQYARAGMTAKLLANWIREQGYFAEAKMGPNTEDVLMIPPAIEAGLGELGKHGSMIHRKLGANFRLSMVLTTCRWWRTAATSSAATISVRVARSAPVACPPNAISPDKQVVNGETKWYVDFDKCLPYFIDDKTCGICLAVCPWSRPGIADNLVVKMARRREATAAA